jgi:hypothetical protein
MRDERFFLALAAEIRQELSSLSRLADEIPATWAKVSTLPETDRPPYVESTALKFHNFYTACERIFETIAGEVNGALPQTSDWHLRLLRMMTVDVPRVRPRVLTPELADRLAELLRFRHVVRNIYGFELHEEKVGPQVDELDGLVAAADRFRWSKAEVMRRALRAFLGIED